MGSKLGKLLPVDGNGIAQQKYQRSKGKSGDFFVGRSPLNKKIQPDLASLVSQNGSSLIIASL